MSGTVIRRDGVRGVVWSIKFRDSEGRQVKERVGSEAEGVTRKHAAVALRHRLSAVETRGWSKPTSITFASFAATWFEEGEKRRRWKPSTVAQYRSTRRRLINTFGPMPLAAIRPRHVAEYVAAKSADLGASTVGRDVSVLQAILTSARREELVETNAAERAERPRLPPFRPQILEPAEVARVVRAFEDEQARLVFLVLVLTGVRRSELQALKWRDVDLVENVLRVRDSKSEEGRRSIAVTPTLAEALWQHRRRTVYQADDALVFCHPERGTVYRAETFKEALTAALKAAGVEKNPRAFHDLRHTAITNDAAAGANPVALMTKAGHASMSTTRRYIHLSGVVFRAEAAALERRLLGTELGTDLGASEATSDDLAPLNEAVSA